MKLKNILIIILSAAVVFLGCLSFFSMNKLISLKEQVSQLAESVQQLSDQTSYINTLNSSSQTPETKTQDTEKPPSQDSSKKQKANDTQKENSGEQAQINPSEGNSKLSDEGEGDLSNLQPQLQEQLNQLNATNGKWSIYTCNLTTNAECSAYNQKMQAASLIKLYIMGCVYENYEALSASNDADTIDTLLRSMITVSDNDAANRLIEMLGNGDSTSGMDKVNDFCQKHGFRDTHMGRLLLDSNSNDDNYTSVEDCGKFLKAIYKGDSSFKNTESMYALLKDQEIKTKIPVGIPTVNGAKVANKTGELGDVENDAGIIYDTPRNDFIICVMSEDLANTEGARSSIAELSRQLYGYFNE